MHYVIGDVHGCFDDMIALLEKIEAKDKDARFIFVGDFVDKGDKVKETVEWCIKNISGNGKYQSVIGNHEWMVLEWFEQWFGEMYGVKSEKNVYPWYEKYCPLSEEMNWWEPEDWKDFIGLFRTMPFYKIVSVKSVWGKNVTYRIVHAFFDYDWPVDPKKRLDAYMWLRPSEPKVDEKEILVHGHTPTIFPDFFKGDFGDIKPGMISYRKNEVNVDGGCMAAGYYPYPCMLCAICLESLEEIYPYSLEERLGNINPENMYFHKKLMGAEEYREIFMRHESPSKKQMLRRLGCPAA